MMRRRRQDEVAVCVLEEDRVSQRRVTDANAEIEEVNRRAVFKLHANVGVL